MAHKNTCIGLSVGLRPYQSCLLAFFWSIAAVFAEWFCYRV